MHRHFAGQTQVITAVLLGGMLIAGVTAAYSWGLPLLQKNQDVNRAEAALSDMKELAGAIENVAASGGSREVTVALGDGALDIDTDGDVITYTSLTRGAYVSTGAWVPLNENDMQGINRTTGERVPDEYGVKGLDSSALLAGNAERADDRFSTTYRIVLRDIFNPDTGQTSTIDLVQDGNLDVSSGSATVSVSSGGEETAVGEGVDGGTLNKKKVLVGVS